MPSHLKLAAEPGFTHVIGVGGIGSGITFQLEGDHTLGREESRLGALLPGRDFCKLHIVEHYIAAMMGARYSEHFRVAAIGVVGNDIAGDGLLDAMSRAGIGTAWVRRDAELPTLFSVCYLYPDHSGGNITSSNSAAAALNTGDLSQARDAMRMLGKRGIALCLPEVPMDMRRQFLAQATECANFRAASFTTAEIAIAHQLKLFSQIDLLSLNEEEASAILGHEYSSGNTDKFLQDCASVLTTENPKMRVVISMGSKGAYGFEHGAWSFAPAVKVNAVSTAGAGDALLGGVISALAAGLPLTPDKVTASTNGISSALQFGVLLASLSVTSPDAIHFGANFDALAGFAASRGIRFANTFRAAIKNVPPSIAAVL
jgi:sugar/nucleoside kinase (ribokinase family)